MKLLLLLLLSTTAIAQTNLYSKTDIQETADRLSTLLEETKNLSNFHLDRVNHPRTYYKDPYNEVQKHITIENYNGDKEIIEKVLLKIKLESYLKAFGENKPDLSLEDLTEIVSLILRTPKQEVRTIPIESTIIFYNISYKSPLNMANFLHQGVEKGFWPEDVLDVLKTKPKRELYLN